MAKFFQNLFRKSQPAKHPVAFSPEWLQAGLLRSTRPSSRAHASFNGNFDIATAGLVSEAERSRLRSACRQEYLDNAYARSAARNFALGVYGQGPTLRMSTEDETLNSAIEKLFRTWRKRTDLDWKFHVALNSLFYDGEAFFVFYQDPEIPGGYDVELIEARRVRDPYAATLQERRREGITYNIFNKPVSYSIEIEPINPAIGHPAEFVEVPASQVMHLYLDDMVNQGRGLPMLQSVLETLDSLARIGRASLNAWELAAKMNILVKTPIENWEFLKVIPKGYNTDDPENNSKEAFSTVPLPEDGGMTFLASGMEMAQVKAEHPMSQFKDNKMTYLSEVGQGVGEPRNIITGDSSPYNYSSAQLDYTTFYRWCSVCQHKLQKFLDRSLKVCIATQEMTNPDAARFLARYDLDDIPCSWYFPPMLADVDRVNNASAEVALVQNGLMTRREYRKKYGIDPEREEEQFIHEKNVLQALGPGIASGEPADGQTAEGQIHSGVLRGQDVHDRDRDPGTAGN